MKKSAAVGIFLLITLMLLGTAACVSPRELTGVQFDEGTFKDTYDIDEWLDSEVINLKLVYDNGDEEVVAAEDIVIEGFDTRTTGRKTLTAEYRGMTAVWEYDVVYGKAPTKSISTTARFTLEQNSYPTGISRHINFSAGDITGARAVYFTVNSSTDFADRDFTRFELEPSDGYDYRLFYVNSKTVKVVLFRLDGVVEEGILGKANLIGSGNRTVYLSDITVSDGERDYYLPDTAEV